MTWDRRPEDETPQAEPRSFRDERGRRWTGVVRSGSERRGEEHAEVIFVCEDQPSEVKRVSRLAIPAAEVGERWRVMPDEQVMDAFRRSSPA